MLICEQSSARQKKNTLVEGNNGQMSLCTSSQENDDEKVLIFKC